MRVDARTLIDVEAREVDTAPASVLELLPLIVASVVILVAASIMTGIKILRPEPNNPWEAGMIVDGWRLSHGQALYSTAHAAGMYGPLSDYILGGLFFVFGVNNQSGRWMSAAGGFLAIGAIAWCFRQKSSALNLAIFACLMGTNLRTGIYFADSRPDSAALLFSVVAVVCFYRGYETRSSGFIAGGVASMLVACYFKQPSALIALIPPVAVGLVERRVRLSTFIPLLALAVAGGLTLIAAPLAFHYLAVVPAQYSIAPYRVVKVPLDFLATMPLFAIAVVHWIGDRKTPVAWWLVSAAGISLLLGTVAAAKQGGSINSLMFAFAACFAFCAYRAPHVLRRLSRLPRLGQRLAFVSAIAAALTLNVFADPAYIIGPVIDRQGGPGYREAIHVVSRLPGVVVSPDDPTIPLYAKGYAGTQAHVEADASKWAFPERVSAELSRADFAIQLDRTVGRRWLSDSVLVASGFVQQKSGLDDKGYRIWSRTRQGRAQ